MPATWKIESEVIDISRDDPQEGDMLLVDANVWFWITYSNNQYLTENAATHQLRAYPAYVLLCRKRRAQLHWSGLNISELANIIERAEFEVFNQLTGRNLTSKEYRHNEQNERARVVAEIAGAFDQVKTLAVPLDTNVDGAASSAAIERMKTQRLDGYDAFVVEAMSKAGIKSILTDDGDFTTVPDITVFTARRDVIEAARAQGRLLR